MESKEKSAASVVLAVLAVSFAIVPLAIATTTFPNYPFELTGRVEYLVPAGTSNPAGHVGQVVFDSAPAIDPVSASSWVPASSYSTSPGHGL